MCFISVRVKLLLAEVMKCPDKKDFAYLEKSLAGKFQVYHLAVVGCCNRNLLPYLPFFVACVVAFVVFVAYVVDDAEKRVDVILDYERVYCSHVEDDTTELCHHFGTQNDEEARMRWTEEDQHSKRNGLGS